MRALFAVVVGIAIGFAWASREDSPEAERPSGIDIGFAQHMSQHHDQAILLASLFLQNHDSDLRYFARGIHDAQLLELGQMRGWLALWGEDLAPSSRSMDWMLAGQQAPDKKLQAYLLACQASPSGMPGLATSDDINALQEAQGRVRDRLFLRIMQKHHEGGLPMLEFAAREARLEPVRQLAQRMLIEQTKETARIAVTLRKQL